MILYPSTRFGKKIVVDIRCEGCFLDMVLGAPVFPIDQEFKSRKVDPVNRKVVSLVEDNLLFIKMDIRGPDILKLPDIKVPESIKVILKTNPLNNIK